MDDPRDPRVLREVLAAQLLGEIDSLLRRVEALVPPINQAVSGLKASAQDTTAVLDRFRVTTQAVVDQAQTSAVDHIINRTNTLAKATVEEQTVAMQAAARSLFDRDAVGLVKSLISELRTRHSAVWLWVPHVTTALLSAVFTVGGIYLLRGG